MSIIRILIVAAALGLTLVTSGCAVVRGQESTSAYVDDAGAISVQTLHGEVALSGFARSADERARAEQIARGVKGVRAVRNNLVVRGGALIVARPRAVAFQCGA